MTLDQKNEAMRELVEALALMDPQGEQNTGEGVDVFWAALLMYYGDFAARRLSQLSDMTPRR